MRRSIPLWALTAAAATLPWLAVGVAQQPAAAAGCVDPPQFSNSARWWTDSSCGGSNWLSNSSSNAVPSAYNDDFQSVEVGNGVSMAYGYKDGGRAGCRKDVHGATVLTTLGYFTSSGCTGTLANNQISSVKIVLS